MADRNVRDVIAQVLQHVPTDHDRLIRRLNDLHERVAYFPPESIGLMWFEFANVLATEIGEPKEDWQKKIRDIITGRLPN